LLTTAAPRVDYTPLGADDGPYVGASGGVAVLTGLASRGGLMGTARAGLRLRPLPTIVVAVEGGIEGQTYEDASAALGYGTLQGRLHF
jgi:hypothetical protein